MHGHMNVRIILFLFPVPYVGMMASIGTAQLKTGLMRVWSPAVIWNVPRSTIIHKYCLCRSIYLQLVIRQHCFTIFNPLFPIYPAVNSKKPPSVSSLIYIGTCRHLCLSDIFSVSVVNLHLTAECCSSTVEVKNEWSCTFTPPRAFVVLVRENLPLLTCERGKILNDMIYLLTAIG